MNAWAYQLIQARCKRCITACIAIFVVMLLLAATQYRYIGNFIAGPFALDEPALNEIHDASSCNHCFVKVKPDKVVTIGTQYATQGDNGKKRPVATYYALTIGHKLLLSENKANSPPFLTGEIMPIPDDLSDRIFGTPQMQPMRDRFYPFYLDAREPFRFRGAVGILAFSLLSLILLAVVGLAWLRMKKPSSHPVICKCMTWGDRNAILAEAGSEYKKPCAKSGNWMVTEHYLIQTSFFGFNIFRLEDLLWAYKTKTFYLVLVIPAKTSGALFKFRNETVEFSGKFSDRGLDSLLSHAAKQAPWAFFDFSEQHKTSFEKNQKAFCDAVDQRKMALKSNPTPVA